VALNFLSIDAALKISWQLVEKGPMRHDSVLRLR